MGAFMYRIIENVFEKELYYKNTVILRYTIKYPEILNSSIGSIKFNKFNYEKAIKLKQHAESDLFEEAKELYVYNESNGYPVMVYEVILDYTITYNQNSIVSLYSDEYIYSGGAHGNTTRSSQNWNIIFAMQFSLNDLFNNNCNYVLGILKNINNQIEQQITDGTNQYFENYCSLVLNTIDLNNFYLNPGYITIFFQQYDIAPYSSGIPTFDIKNNR